MPDLFLYVLLAAMLVMMFLSSRRRKAAAAQLQEQVVVGAKVVLLSGIVGEIISIDEDKMVISTAGSKLEVLKGAIRTAVAPQAVSLSKETVPAAKVSATKAATKTTSSSTVKPAAKKQSASIKK